MNIKRYLTALEYQKNQDDLNIIRRCWAIPGPTFVSAMWYTKWGYMSIRLRLNANIHINGYYKGTTLQLFHLCNDFISGTELLVRSTDTNVRYTQSGPVLIRPSITWYSALPIYRGLFSPNNSRKTPIARPLVWDMVVFRELLVLPKFYLRVYCAVCSIVLYCTAIYR